MLNLLNKINILHNCRQRQRGAALMVMLVILILGAAALLLNSLSGSTLRLERDKVTTDALVQAKEALIGRAIADGNHPGSLPCPDTHTPGGNMEGTADSSCTVNVLGRLPWKTLGVNDLRDGSGEKLWYTLSPNFADNSSNKINSNSNGILQVYDNGGTNLLTPAGSEAIAIIFAPGSIVDSQQRNSDTDKTTASNYLDIGANSINNATAAGPFTAAYKTGTFNDRLMIIKASDLMPLVEKRVAKELINAFTNSTYGYLINHANKYPYPADFNTCNPANLTANPTTACISNTSVCKGKIPVTDMGSALVSMTWFKSNNWYDVIYYSAGTNGVGGGSGGWGGGSWRGRWGGGGANWSGGGGSGSTACTASYLTILDTNGATLTSNANALFLMPDFSITGATRSISMSTSNLAQFFEDLENKNKDDIYVLPGATSNDMLNILP